jgi:hypothetical protein
VFLLSIYLDRPIEHSRSNFGVSHGFEDDGVLVGYDAVQIGS